MTITNPQDPPVVAQQTYTQEQGEDDIDLEPYLTDIWQGDQSRLPPFWKPKDGEDLDSRQHQVAGAPSVYLMVASYRDFQCRETITSAFDRASNPNRVIVGAVQQDIPGDIGCTEPMKPCEEDPTQALCARRHQIRLFRMNAKHASGPVLARHIGDRLYRGESYAMQVDAHVIFIRDWDKVMIQQLDETRNEYAVLSTYLTDVQGSISPEGKSLRKTRPIMCNSHFEGGGETSHIRHLAQPEEMPALKGVPMLQPYWAAGMSFSRGHFITRVPYDCCLPFLFQGEEVSIGIRGFTFGYDFYAPHTSVIFHEYAVNSKRRKGVHAFWENPGGKGGRDAMRRMVAITKMAPDIDPSSYAHEHEELYGLGTERPVELFYKVFGMDVRKKTLPGEMCKFVKSGLMHNTFSPSLRPDGKGIDYSQLTDFNINEAIQGELRKAKALAEKHLRGAMSRRKLPGIDQALLEAKRARLGKSELVLEAEELRGQLKQNQ